MPYTITNSARFNGASGYLERNGGTHTNQKRFTASVWLKPCDTQVSGTQDNCVLSHGTASDSYANSTLNFVRTNGTLSSYLNDASSHYFVCNNHSYRDPSAWFHVVVRLDTLASNTERHRIYVNGTQIPSTSASSFSEVTHNSDMPFTGNGQRIWLGKAGSGNNHYYDGYMADFAYSEGYNYGPEAFGEVDSTTGNWIPKDPTTYHAGSGIAYGNNGFLLQFKQSGGGADTSGIGADTSGNSNHIAATSMGTNYRTQDCPSNNFCTWNPRAIGYDQTGGSYSGMVHGHGNTTAMNNSASGWATTLGTFLIPTAGKWYWELKNIEGSDHIQVGVMECPNGDAAPTTGAPADSSGLGWGWYSNNGQDRQNGSNVNTFSSWTSANDIVMIAYDANTGKLWLGKNGTWETLSSNVGNPGAGAYPHMTVDSNPVVPLLGTANINSGNGPWVNFGNPAFSIASGNADANGYGNFEYAVPTGFYSLCTKNLASYGGTAEEN